MDGDGLSFGRYLLLDRIAAGGMGEVYVGLQTGIGKFTRPIAVKLLLPHLADDPGAVSMFLTEARVGAQMVHSNITQVYDVGFDHGRYFIAMELVRGISLSKLISGLKLAHEQLSANVLTYVGRSLCDGLHVAHEQKGPAGNPLEVVHRDVTPHNILVSVDGAVKLSDFGIARVADADRLSRPGVLLGKLGYLAPEQILGKPVDRRVDVFAAGATLYHLAALEKPFDTPTGSVLDPGRLPTVPLRVCRPDLPRELIDAIEKAMEVDPDRRFLTAKDFRAALPPPGPDVAEELGKLVRRIGAESLVELESKTEAASRAAIEGKLPETLPDRPSVGRRATPAPSALSTSTGQAVRASKAPIALAGVLGLALVAGVAWLLTAGGSEEPAAKPAPTEATRPAEPDAATSLATAPATVVTAPPDAGAAVDRTPGLLTVDATPWGEVSLDGRRLGETPLANVRVPAGSHVLTVRNPDNGKVARRVVTILPGKPTALRLDVR